MQKNTRIYTLIGIVVLIVLAVVYVDIKLGSKPISKLMKHQVASVTFALLPKRDSLGNYLYEGPIYHIFFHSLIVYPELAKNDTKHKKMFEEYMVTRDEFDTILPALYANNFMLIDIHLMYSVNTDGSVEKKGFYLPKGKKPLIISLDDLSYYHSQRGDGFADKLVFDEYGNVATEIITPDKTKKNTRTGDVVPILDDFVAEHPDFSFNGAKGIIALTGFDGVLGYQTQASTSPSYHEEISSAQKIIARLKATGWSFASHSYSHDSSFQNDTISLQNVITDSNLWDTEVKPLVGDTDIFIGPFGQIFKHNDPRQQFLLSRGYKMLCGVGAQNYLHYFPDHVVMDRADIDGYRLNHTPHLLRPYFDPAVITH